LVIAKKVTHFINTGLQPGDAWRAGQNCFNSFPAAPGKLGKIPLATLKIQNLKPTKTAKKLLVSCFCGKVSHGRKRYKNRVAEAGSPTG
jgi:hypothetical protein